MLAATVALWVSDFICFVLIFLLEAGGKEETRIETKNVPRDRRGKKETFLGARTWKSLISIHNFYK